MEPIEKYDAIYCRQSVDRLDSISVESQAEYCLYETRGGANRIFTDKGYSGKNTDRPQFQDMLEAVRHGEVKRVIVYRLDRISRSVLDFMNLFEEFQRYGVEFVSCTEKFDTSSPMGRAMLKIIVVFAELERETIQQRVCDAYVSRSRRGFYMGGRLPYGFITEPFEIDGKKTSRYKADPVEAGVVRGIFEMYAAPQTSFGDIIKKLDEQQLVNARTKDGRWTRSRLADMIKNPIYVRADEQIYSFYQNAGSMVHNDPSDFIGINGCYLYSEKASGRKTVNLSGQHIVLAPHEGIVPADIWLKARRKCMNNRQVAIPIKAKNTWLAGKIKCGKCGYALTVKKARTEVGKYLICSRHLNDKGCEGVGGLHAVEIENLVKHEIEEHLREFRILHAPQNDNVPEQRDLELRARIASIQVEIDQLISKLPEAGDALVAHINKRVTLLDQEQRDCQKELDRLIREKNKSDENISSISNYMDRWNNLSFDDKRSVVDLLISRINCTKTTCEIVWKF